MATAQEILNAMEEVEEQNVIVIDSDLRTIRIPEGIKILGVESDDDVLRLHFKMPKMYGEFDLSTFALRVNYLNANSDGDVFVVQDAAANGDELKFSWLVGRTAAQYKGDVKFIVCAKKVKEGGIVEKEFNTTPATLPVLEGLETIERVAQENPDVIEAILLRLDKLEKNGGGAEPDATLTQSGKAADAKATGDALNELKEANAKQDTRLTALEQTTPSGTSGLTVAQVNALDNLFKVIVYTEDATDEYAAFRTAFGLGDSGGGEEPDEPDVPEKTLTSISATYSGGDVTAGTDVSDLTGITVTAHYSDGSTETVTGYTISGEIAEGANTITVSYSGKTATFTVTGVAAESGGDDETVETNGWTNGEAYNIEWIDGYRISDTNTGIPSAFSGRSVTGYLPCQNASRLNYTGTISGYAFFYDEEKTLITYKQINDINRYNIPIPVGSVYWQCCVGNTDIAGFSATPYRDPLLGENTPWITDTFYRMEFTVGQSINGTTGAVGTDNNRTVSSIGYCYGATSIKLSTGSGNIRAYCYETNGEFLSNMQMDTATGTLTVPEGAKTFRFHDYSKVAYYNEWVKLS